jgi:hypothetical protein
MEKSAMNTPLFVSAIVAVTGLLWAVSSVLDKLTPLLVELRNWIF